MRRLLEYVASAPDDDVPLLTIQDMALCQVWLANDGGDEEPVAGQEALAGRIQHWLAEAHSPSRPSEGRRSQTLLRELIDRIEAGHVDQMSRDELDLLEAVYGLAQAAKHADKFERVRRVIAPYRTRIASRRRSVEDVRGMPALAKRLMVVNSEDIRRSPQREVRMLAGVELPSRGPVLTHNGHLRVLGDVPENATLVVEEAACVVDGFVMGRVAASGSCEILENVSGVVISRNGDIRVRNIVDGAYVVAKRGWVHSRRCQGARLVFAGACLRIVDQAARSRLFAPIIDIEGAAESGELHVSKRAEADVFAADGDSPLNIVFRRSLSCKDYGEDPGKTMAADVSHAIRLRAEVLHLRQQMQLAIQSAEQCAEAALMHLLAGDESGRLAKEMASAHRRLEVLHRILVGMRTMYSHAEAELENVASEDAANAHADSDTLVADIEDEIDHLLADLPEESELAAERAHMSDVRSRLEGERGDCRALTTTMAGLADRLKRWRSECEDLNETLHRSQDALRKQIAATGLLSEGPAARSKVLALQQVVARAKAQPEGHKLRQRLESSFVTLMLKTIHKRLADAKKVKERLETSESGFAQARDHVWTSYQMRIGDEDSAEHRMIAEGRFEAGVRLYADAMYLTENARDLPEEGSVVARATGEERTRYICVAGTVSEAPMGSAAEKPVETASAV